MITLCENNSFFISQCDFFNVLFGCRSSALIKKYVNRTSDRIVAPKLIADKEGRLRVPDRAQVCCLCLTYFL